MKVSQLVLLIAVVFCGAHPAHALTIVGGPTFGWPKPSDNTKSPYASALSIGGGVGFVIGVKSISLETDVMYSPKKFTLSNYNITASFIEVPIILWIPAFSFGSIGLGPYGAFAAGDIERTSGNSSSISKISYSNAQLNQYTAGAVASGRLYLSPGADPGIFVEARYLLGLANDAVVGSFKYRTFMIFLGLRMGK